MKQYINRISVIEPSTRAPTRCGGPSLAGLVLLGLLVACGPPSNDANGNDAGGLPDADPETVPLRGVCDTAERLGGFTLKALELYPVVEGSVLGGVVPASVRTVEGSEGDCRLLRQPNLFCNPSCDPGQTCDTGGTCIPMPATQDMGTVTVTGLKQPVEMTPRQPGNKYFDTSLPNPPFEPGALVRLRTTAGAFGELLLHGVGVQSLTVTDVEWIITRDQALTVRWNSPTGDVRSRVLFKLDIDEHGASPLSLQCDFADTGEATVPSSLLNQLLDAGITGFPRGRLSRRTADRTSVPDGCIDLIVASPVEVDVRVSGHLPCDEPEDCPSGLTCNLQTETCE